MPPSHPHQPESQPPQWHQTQAPPGIPESTPLPSARQAASMYRDWLISEFFAQAEERASWRLSTAIPPPTEAWVLGAWAATWGTKSIIWNDPEAPAQFDKASVEVAVRRLLEFHSRSFSEGRRVVLTCHLHEGGGAGNDFFVNRDLLSRAQSTSIFATSLPLGAPVGSGAEEFLPIQPVDLAGLDSLLQIPQTPARARYFVTAVEASQATIRAVGLFASPRRSIQTVIGRSNPADLLRMLPRLAAVLHHEDSALVITVASVSEACERWWVLEDKAKTLSEATQTFLKDADLDGASAPDIALSKLNIAWQTVRQEVKPRLEALIESLSKRTFETYEEKAEVAARLNELLDEWKFRAISPSSGRVAYFQCRVGKKTTNGYFFFQDVDAGSAPVGKADPKGPKAPGQIPIFKLADAPPDSRRRPPDLQPVPRKKRKS